MNQRAFTLVEVILALGIVTFALLTVVALLPIGAKMNRTSIEETRAANLLSTLAADVRNTHPGLNAGKSRIFGLPLPYKETAGKIEFNSSLEKNMLAGYTTGLKEDETSQAITAVPPPQYQVSIVYTRVPTDLPPGSLSPVEARLIVNWPALNGSNITNLTSRSSVSGFVESYVTFPAP